MTQLDRQCSLHIDPWSFLILTASFLINYLFRRRNFAGLFNFLYQINFWDFAINYFVLIKPTPIARSVNASVNTIKYLTDMG